MCSEAGASTDQPENNGFVGCARGSVRAQRSFRKVESRDSDSRGLARCVWRARDPVRTCGFMEPAPAHRWCRVTGIVAATVKTLSVCVVRSPEPARVVGRCVARDYGDLAPWSLTRSTTSSRLMFGRRYWSNAISVDKTPASTHRDILMTHLFDTERFDVRWTPEAQSRPMCAHCFV